MKNPFLIHRPNGYFKIVFFDKYTKKRKVKTTGTINRSTANKILSDFIKEDIANQVGKDITLSGFKKLFFETGTANMKDNTIRNYKYIFNNFLSFSGDKFLNDYTLLDFDRYLTYKINTRKPQTAHLHRRSLKVIFDKAHKWNYLKENIIGNSIKIKIPENQIKYFKKDEFAKLIEITDNQLLKDMFLFAVLTGMRMNEILNCKYSDIDLEKNLIRVYGRKTDKTRYVELHRQLVPVIEKYKENDLMFNPENKFTVDYVSKVTKKLIRKADINPALNFKAFRSTFGKWLLDYGVNLKFISMQLGHSNISVTENHYSRYITSEPTGWVNKLDL